MITCWVRSAISAACSLGSASVSSSALVCGELVPPSARPKRLDASARTTLLYGCWAVSETSGLGVEPQPLRILGLRAVNVAHPSAPDAPGRAELGDLLEEVHVGVEEGRTARGRGVDVEGPREPNSTYPEAVGERERELLRGFPSRRPPGCGSRRTDSGSAGMFAARYSIRSPVSLRVRLGREQPLLLRVYSAQKMSVCSVPLKCGLSTSARSAATRHHAEPTGTAGLIVIEVVTSPQVDAVEAPPCRPPGRSRPHSDRPRPATSGSSESRPIQRRHVQTRRSGRRRHFPRIIRR